MTSGHIDPGTSQMKFINKDIHISGSFDLYDCTFWNSWGSYGNIYLEDSCQINVLNKLTYGGNQKYSRIEGLGKVRLKGDFHCEDSYSQFGGKANIVIDGNTDQHIYGSTNVAGAQIPGLIVNKTGGTLYIHDYVRVREGDYLHVTGNI